MAILSRYAVPITEQETRCGFDVIEAESGVVVVRVALASGLFAVKTRREDDTFEYIICNADFGEIYPPAKSLAELKQRFVPTK